MHDTKTVYTLFLHIWSSTFTYCPYILTSAFLIVIGHTDLSSGFLLLLAPVTFLDQSQYFFITLIAVFLLSVFHLVNREVLSLHFSHQIFITDDHPILVFCLIFATIFGFLYLIRNSSWFRILHFDILSGRIFLSIFHYTILKDDFIFSLIAHFSQPHRTTGFIIAIYIFSCITKQIKYDIQSNILMSYHRVVHVSVPTNHHQALLITTIWKKNSGAFEHAIILLVRSH
jgi:hypothetical protein